MAEGSDHLLPALRAKEGRGNKVVFRAMHPQEQGYPGWFLRYPLDVQALEAEFRLTDGHRFEHGRHGMAVLRCGHGQWAIYSGDAVAWVVGDPAPGGMVAGLACEAATAS